MRTKIVLLSASVLVTTGITMHHFRYCPLQHLKAAFAHHQSSPTANVEKTKDAKAAANTAILVINK